MASFYLEGVVNSDLSIGDDSMPIPDMLDTVVGSEVYLAIALREIFYIFKERGKLEANYTIKGNKIPLEHLIGKEIRFMLTPAV